MNRDEIWTPIVGHSGYEVSSAGRVRSFKNSRWGPRDQSRLLALTLFNNGYLTVTLTTESVGTKYLVHRLVASAFLGDISGLYVDHIDGNPLNNCVKNLRVATGAQNTWNAPGRGGTSIFKGVSFNKRRGHWYACISERGRTKALGRFSTEEEAARAYDAAALRLHGEFARLNFSSKLGSDGD